MFMADIDPGWQRTHSYVPLMLGKCLNVLWTTTMHYAHYAAATLHNPFFLDKQLDLSPYATVLQQALV